MKKIDNLYLNHGAYRFSSGFLYPPLNNRQRKPGPKKSSLLFFAIGLSLCCTIPIVAIGPSFIIWPSSSELGGYALLVLAIKRYFGLNDRERRAVDRFGSNIKMLWIAVYWYIGVITLVMTDIMQFKMIYPGWTLFRLMQWFFIIPYLLFYCNEKEIKSLSYGILLGAIINGIVCILQRIGILMPSQLFAHLMYSSGGGYWAKIAERGGLIGGESIGIYSYSRVATGFFLGISPALIVTSARNWFVKISLLIVVLIGIAFTGSRTGLVAFFLVLFMLFFSKRYFLISAFIMIIFVLSVYIMLPFIQKDKVMGRFVGSSISYQDSLKGRTDRHDVVLSLPIDKLIFGCGLGNLGSALEKYESPISTDFYRAHGYMFTYLGEVGLIGSLLLSFATLKMLLSIPYKITRPALGIILATIFSGFTDDFMIPAASGGHLALIVVIVYRMGLIEGAHSQKIGSIRNCITC